MTPAKTWEDIDGWFEWQRIYDDWIRDAPDDGIIIEIGSWYGRSTCYGAKIVRESGKPIRFIAVDHCVGALKGYDASAHLMARGDRGTIAGDLHRNIIETGGKDSAMILVAESVRASSLFPDGSVYAVFVDGGHKKDVALADIAAWWPKLMSGGEMAGHDYNDTCPGVIEAVREFFGRDCPSARATNCWEIKKS